MADLVVFFVVAQWPATHMFTYFNFCLHLFVIVVNT